MLRQQVLNNLKRAIIAAFLTLSVIGIGNGADLQKGRQALKAKDYQLAYSELKPLAEQGNAIAQYNIGRMYSKGHYVPMNLEKALVWYRKSAEQGHEKALNNLGLAYFLCKGLKQNYQMAYMFFGVAAHLGNERSKKNVGIVAEKLSKKKISQAKKMIKACIAQKIQRV